MKSLDLLIDEYVKNGFTVMQARYQVAQKIILTKLEESSYVDKVLLKGGIVMYNITQEQRRTTSDLDIDFIRLDISKEQNIVKFIEVLNKKEPLYHLGLKSTRELHQQDYKGKRLELLISDDYGSKPVRFTMDIGVHTLLGIEQQKMCFVFMDGKQLSLWANPPEQIFAEKVFSLAKIGPTSGRYKDLNDLYYLITSCGMNKKIVKKCFELLTIGHPYGIYNLDKIISRVENTLNNELFIQGFANQNNLWLDVDYHTIKTIILDFIYEI